MIVERPGPDAHPLIQAFLQFTQLHNTPAAQTDETPWCSAFVCACMELAGYESTKHALAHSWLNWGEEIPDYREGCILVFEKTNHVAFCDHVPPPNAHAVFALGGNQQNKVCGRMYDQGRVISKRWLK